MTMIIALVAPLVVSGFVKRKSEIVGVGRLFKLSIHLQKEKKKKKKEAPCSGHGHLFLAKEGRLCKNTDFFFLF